MRPGLGHIRSPHHEPRHMALLVDHKTLAMEIEQRIERMVASSHRIISLTDMLYWQADSHHAR